MKAIKGHGNFSKDMEDRDRIFTNYIIFSASQANEIAEDSPDGGLFTLSLKDAIVYGKANRKRERMTVMDLERFCSRNIFELASEYRKRSKGDVDIHGAFTPKFRPNKILNQPLISLFGGKFKPIQQKKKEELLLEDTLDGLQKRGVLKVDGYRKRYVDGDRVRFEITSKKSGYLNIFIAYRDSYELFLKNSKISKNRLYTFPNDFLKGEHLVAKSSKGNTNIYVVLSQKPISIDRFIRSKKDNLALTNHFRKELMPHKEYLTKKKKKIVEKSANILGLNKISFSVSKVKVKNETMSMGN